MSRNGPKCQISKQSILRTALVFGTTWSPTHLTVKNLNNDKVAKKGIKIFIYINYQNKVLPFFLKQLCMSHDFYSLLAHLTLYIDGGGLATRELIFLVP